HREQVQSGEHAVAGGGVLGQDDVTGLLAAQGVLPGQHGLEHVPVADQGLHHGDTGVVHGQPETEIGHDRDHHGVPDQPVLLLQLGGQHGQDLVSVDHLAGGVHGQAAVGVPVVGDADVGGLGADHGGDRFQVGGAAAGVDVL